MIPLVSFRFLIRFQLHNTYNTYLHDYHNLLHLFGAISTNQKVFKISHDKIFIPSFLIQQMWFISQSSAEEDDEEDDESWSSLKEIKTLQFTCS